MTCHCCNGEVQKFGSFKNVNRLVQRYRCVRCNKTFSESQPLDGLRVDFDKACQVVNLLCEGMGIRACERLMGLNRRTILGILETAGERCARLLDAKVTNVKASHVQIDEIYAFVNCKPQNTTRDDPQRGEFFTYLAVDKASKLILNWRTSKRDGENTLAFMQDLKRRVAERCQITTDAYMGYWRGNGAVRQVFGSEVDYATEIKVWGKTNLQISRYFNPMRIVGIKRQMRIGNPDLSKATICHAERTNLTVRTFTRRFTRCTIGYSKKLDNLRHAVALFVAHFNFCRVHSAHNQTPAHTAGLTDHTWNIAELLSPNDLA